VATDNGKDMQAIERFLELLVKLTVQQLKGDKSQSEMILLLDSLGFTSGEVAKFLGASPATVRPILSRAHSKRKRK
jgi:DNA-directed RNA polymerase specialized sigma24 family protein